MKPQEVIRRFEAMLNADDVETAMMAGFSNKISYIADFSTMEEVLTCAIAEIKKANPQKDNEFECRIDTDEILRSMDSTTVLKETCDHFENKKCCENCSYCGRSGGGFFAECIRFGFQINDETKEVCDDYEDAKKGEK